MSKIPDLTPPTKAAKAPKAEKIEKAPKAEKAPADPNAPKKERAARQDYGFAKDAVIKVDHATEAKYRGQRKEWFDILVANDGKTVEAFMTAAADRKTKSGKADPPRGWLRFFVTDGAATLSAPSV